jgi:hypothetical protein
MDIYFQEMLQNFKRVAGYIFSSADLAKLEKEKRPTFIYNLLLPVLLRLSGSFKDNLSRVEAQPRTPDDFGMAKIMTDLLDYSHYTANDVGHEMAMAFIFACIGRVGWITNEWSYVDDPEGMNYIYVNNPFSIMWDGGFTRRDLKTTRALIKRGWFSPEEIVNNFCQNDPEMRDEVLEKAKMFLGKDGKTDKLLKLYERTFGATLTYQGENQGYDSMTNLLNGLLYNNYEYYDAARGSFKVIECHERRLEQQYTLYDPQQNKLWDITKIIEGNKQGYNNDKLQLLRQQYIGKGIDPVIKDEPIELIYQVDVCPSLNMKLYDASYPVQNGLFKDTPVFCFDFGVESIEHKSYVDLLCDLVSDFNLTQNTYRTLLMKMTHGETWYEEDALSPGHEEEFLDNRLGKKVPVANGAIAGNKIKRVDPSAPPQGLIQNETILQNLLPMLTGQYANAYGDKVSANEPGVLFAQRVQQSDKMLAHVLSNTHEQLKIIAKNTKDLFKKYLTPDRMIKIVGDESDPYWLQINSDSVMKLKYDKEGNPIGEEMILGSISKCDYNIVLSQAPFGDFAKQQEFDRINFLYDKLGKLDLGYIDPAILVKASGSKYTPEILSRIRQRDQQKALELQQQIERSEISRQQQIQNDMLAMQDRDLDMRKKAQELSANDLVNNAVQTALG